MLELAKIPISGIGYWDSLTSLGQNGFGPALLSLQLGIRRRAWAAAPAKADNRRRSRTRESGQQQTPPHPRKRTTADAGAAAAAAARSPDRKRLPCIQVYSVMTPLADSSMRRPAYSQPSNSPLDDSNLWHWRCARKSPSTKSPSTKASSMLRFVVAVQLSGVIWIPDHWPVC